MPIQAIRSQRLYRQIADQLQQLINNGEFPLEPFFHPSASLHNPLASAGRQ